MINTFSRSYHLVKQSYAILKKDKELLWFPIISGILTTLLFLSFIIPLFLTSTSFTPSYYAILFLYYLISYFIIIFFNTGLIAAANIRLNGGDPTFMDGFNEAKKHVVHILGWSILAATVGLILRIIIDKLEERSELLGAILVSFLGAAWSILTFFVIPVMVFENKNVFAAIKSSGQLMKKTWGESLMSAGGLGFFFFLLGLIGVIPIILAILFHSPIAIMITIAIAVLYWIVLGIFSSSLNGILIASLYQFATTGKVTEGFDDQEIKSAFTTKNRS
jgi:hypothetical protein